MRGYNRITKRAFYHAGAFSNPRCVRVTRGGRWAYFYRQGD
jgi:hypothetical protein